MTTPTWLDAYGAIPNPYPDIPSEYQVGLDRGQLGDWLQEVADAGWDIRIEPYDGVMEGGAAIGRAGSVSYWGTDNETHRVDIMLVRACLAWKGREG